MTASDICAITKPWPVQKRVSISHTHIYMHADTLQPHMHSSTHTETHTYIRTYTNVSFFLLTLTDCWTRSNRILCTRRQRKVWIKYSANGKSVSLYLKELYFSLLVYFITFFVQEDIICKRERDIFCSHFYLISFYKMLQVWGLIRSLNQRFNLFHSMWWTVKTPLAYLTCRLTILMGFALRSMRWGLACAHPVRNVWQCVCV